MVPQRFRYRAVQLPVTVLGSASNNLLVGSVGGGGPLVELSTQSGYISIE
jgi:hypothetical protein